MALSPLLSPHRLASTACLVWVLMLLATTGPRAGQSETVRTRPHAAPALFKTSDSCLACHNSLVAATGEDVSIGSDWRATMMANSSRDPYWQASVRREALDHPKAAAAIEDECSICHMPMAHAQAKADGRDAELFAHLPVTIGADAGRKLAHDGVSCTVCHQITSERLGSPESFTGRFVVSTQTSTEPRSIFGPYAIDKGRTTIMRSATDFIPTESMHIRQSELCATCHTLITQALGSSGEPIGRLAEQVPYLEWKHSAYRDEQSCQSCHMPVVEETPIASVLGEPRQLFRHVFQGGNFLMLRMLNRYRAELGVEAASHELDAAARRTVEHLQTATASVAIERAVLATGRLEADVVVTNRAGHKLPTGYPSRRAWLHVTIADRDNRVIFESGALRPSGAIIGNDNDAIPFAYEMHHREIRSANDVQIYESVMGDSAGRPTTGLLQAVRYLKDNRLLPRGFNKRTAEPDIDVIGEAGADDDFVESGDRVRYSVDVTGREGPFTVSVELQFQPIGFRWAENLKAYDAREPRRFNGYFDSMSGGSAETLARTATRVPAS
jgi:hypothetical protein